jgi:hypothetical protein
MPFLYPLGFERERERVRERERESYEMMIGE